MVKSGKTESFSATMILYGNPTLATFEGFYEIVLEQAES
jgi:hypothetical protein